jgi:hypothetical protein
VAVSFHHPQNIDPAAGRQTPACHVMAMADRHPKHQMLDGSPHRRGPKAESGSTSRPGRGRPTDKWLVGPVAQCYIKEVEGHGSRYEILCAATHPTYKSTTLATEGALERREAPPSPSRTSCFITRTRCHRSHLRRFPNATFTEPTPSLPPLGQGEEAPATSTDEMVLTPFSGSTSKLLCEGRSDRLCRAVRPGCRDEPAVDLRT